MSAPVAVGWPQVFGWRLRRQGLVEPFADLPTAVARLAGVQAQVPSAAKHALWLRTADGTPGAVERALVDERSLVRTWAMRGTLHLLPAAEWRTWTAALSQRVARVDAAWERYHGITADELEAVTAAIPRVLAGRELSREELTDALVAEINAPHVAEALRSGWGAALKPAANLGLVCHGSPRPGGGVTFVRPQDWLDPAMLHADGGAPAVGPDEVHAAVGAVITAFLEAHGPATVDDFARWFGVRPPVAKRLWRNHAPPVTPVDVDGAPMWVTDAAADSVAVAEPVEGAWLQPAFDPYVLHPRSHRDVAVPAHAAKAVSRAGGWISPVVLVDGWVAATWAQETAEGRTTVAVTMLRDDLAARVDGALPALLAGLGTWLGTDVVRS